ncbi:hypothetical protein TcWFU_004291 [Taenia crassiceps]|uniref:Uncharacterized protein n=1 Tax=Taenia crassiceps TaxID=6207 RepID=A0ABR4QBC4_9CEST
MRKRAGSPSAPLLKAWVKMPMQCLFCVDPSHLRQFGLQGGFAYQFTSPYCALGCVWIFTETTTSYDVFGEDWDTATVYASR